MSADPKAISFLAGTGEDEPSLIHHFATTFAAAEGAHEGAVIGGLVRDILAGTADDFWVMRAVRQDVIVGAVIFTRLRYPSDPTRVVLMSPVAVAPDDQRKGVGQGLIRCALDHLRDAGVDVVLSYGDPAYYNRVGFAQVPETRARAPQPLSLPHGWIGLSLDGSEVPVLSGKPRSVPAFDRPEIW